MIQTLIHCTAWQKHFCSRYSRHISRGLRKSKLQTKTADLKTSMASHSECDALRSEIASLKAQLEDLTSKCGNSEAKSQTNTNNEQRTTERTFGAAKLTKRQIERYSRQMLCPDLGPMGTRALLDSKVLVVGAGGLGATVIPYLVSAGVGHVIIVDFDTVDESNLHRQIIHTESRVGMQKALSAKIFAENLNSKDTVIEAICEPFSVENAQALCRRVDVVIDASDNVACRYLVNDAAVLEGKPLVSGCATRWEGQLTVYNCRYPVPPQLPPAVLAKQKAAAAAAGIPDGSGSHLRGPCYRCLFPTPTPASAVGSCNEVGVLGPVPGVIGCLQALEAIKALTLLSKWRNENTNTGNSIGVGPNKNTQNEFGKNIDLLVGRMLLFDGLRSSSKVVRIRGQQPTCVICSAKAREEHGVVPSTATNTMIPVTALRDAHYGPRGLFPEYTTGVLCELPDSAPRVDKALSAPSHSHVPSATNAEQASTTLSATTGIPCREATVDELKDAIEKTYSINLEDDDDAVASTAPKPHVIVVDVRPSAQQTIFSLSGDSENPSSSSAARKNVRLLSFDGDTFDGMVTEHVETILNAVREEAVAVEPSLSMSSNLKKRRVETTTTTTTCDAHDGEKETHFVSDTHTHRSNSDSRDIHDDARRPTVSVHFLCRRGNKSRRAIYAVAPLLSERLRLLENVTETATENEASKSSSNGVKPEERGTNLAGINSTAHVVPRVELVNVIGGLTYWARDVDGGFPQI